MDSVPPETLAIVESLKSGDAHSIEIISFGFKAIITFSAAALGVVATLTTSLLDDVQPYQTIWMSIPIGIFIYTVYRAYKTYLRLFIDFAAYSGASRAYLLSVKARYDDLAYWNSMPEQQERRSLLIKAQGEMNEELDFYMKLTALGIISSILAVQLSYSSFNLCFMK